MPRSIEDIEGYYEDDLAKYQCLECGWEFIVGETVTDAAAGISCPYCWSVDLLKVARIDAECLAPLKNNCDSCLTIRYSERNLDRKEPP